jgi:hypothetical protein
VGRESPRQFGSSAVGWDGCKPVVDRIGLASIEKDVLASPGAHQSPERPSSGLDGAFFAPVAALMLTAIAGAVLSVSRAARSPLIGPRAQRLAADGLAGAARHRLTRYVMWVASGDCRTRSCSKVTDRSKPSNSRLPPPSTTGAIEIVSSSM